MVSRHVLGAFLVLLPFFALTVAAAGWRTTLLMWSVGALVLATTVAGLVLVSTP